MKCLQKKEEQDSMTISPRSGRILAVLLTCGTLLATPLYAEEAPRTQEIKPQQPKVQDPKSQEPKNLEPAPPELKQEPRTKEPTNEPAPGKPVRSLILTVKLALLGDLRTALCTIEVDTKGQDVLLSGKVSSEVEKLASAEVARQVDGVKSVVNKLEVVSDLYQVMMQKRDQVITEYIRERFKKSATLEAARFDIKTENGVVEMSGKTRFQVIVLEAAEAARQVPGVKAVKTQAVRIEGAE
jgi:hyperosmotically inducible protein